MVKVQKLIDDKANDVAIAKERQDRETRSALHFMSLQVVVLRKLVFQILLNFIFILKFGNV
jgi:hypothetical protein